MTAERAYFIHLFASALNGTQPDEKPDGITFEELYRESARQNLLAAVFCSVNKLTSKPSKELFDRWQTDFLRKSLICDRMTREADELSTALSGQGVPVMLLKGCVTRPLYPEPVYRSMSDIDLIYFTDDLTFHDAMLRLGYTRTAVHECHDIYIKGHYTRIETHRKLFTDDCIYGTLFKGIQARAISDAENPKLLRMTDEDAYLHLVCHAAKHFENTGIGLRVLADVYVTLRAQSGRADSRYINEKLEAVGLLRFKNLLEQIASAWFGGGEITLPQVVEDEFFLGSTYGNDKTTALRQASMTKSGVRKAKFTYYFKTIFMSKSNMKIPYPVLTKHPWLLPACEVHRWFKKLFFKKESINTVRHKSAMLTENNINRQKECFSFFGISGDDAGL